MVRGGALWLAGVLTICLLGVSLVRAQTGAAAPAGEKPLLSEQAFKDVQVLRGIPVKEFMETMGFFSAALAYNCSDCHGSTASWSDYATDNPVKQTARRMVLMVNALNRANFGVPVRYLEAPGFGRAVSTVTPGRRVQFALKYVF